MVTKEIGDMLLRVSELSRKMPGPVTTHFVIDWPRTKELEQYFIVIIDKENDNISYSEFDSRTEAVKFYEEMGRALDLCVN